MWLMSLMIYLLHIYAPSGVSDAFIPFFGLFSKDITSSIIFSGVNIRVTLTFIACICILIGMAGMFKKAGKPWWLALIPGVNIFMLFKISSAMPFLIAKLILIAIALLIKDQTVTGIVHGAYIITDICFFISLKEAFDRSGWIVFALLFFYPIAMLNLGISKKSIY